VRTSIVRAVLIATTTLIGSVYADDPHPTYFVTNLASLGGTNGGANAIDNRGWASGFSNLPGDLTTHATLWRDGTLTDLGTLGGPNSVVGWPVKNDRGIISGFAETSALDPFGEKWSCSAFFPTVTHHTCLGFVWENGVMHALPTLGGNNGLATGSNNSGHVVGWAENAVHDSTCVAPQVLQFRAVEWAPDDTPQELPPLPGDTTSAATAINDRGQVAGISGICDRSVGRFSARHAVLWDHGNVTNLGDLGGVAWNTSMSINDRGDVTGFANTPVGTAGGFHAHAFLWTKKDGMRDLGTLPGHAISEGLGINSRGQVVGMSCTAGFAVCHAFLWDDGVMTDLNAPGVTTYNGTLIFAGDINDAGEITGGAFDADSSTNVAFVAAPRHQ
jgi:probable HAF family extracellular repeat protein